MLVQVPIKAIQGQLYVRISCHIHNELKDYENLGEAILTLAGERKKDSNLMEECTSPKKKKSAEHTMT